MTLLEEIIDTLNRKYGLAVAITVLAVLKEFQITEEFVKSYGTLTRDTLNKIQGKKE